jgi:hypothetical protein
MEQVTIKKTMLKEKLTENLKKHDDLYEKALENYWKTVEETLKEKVEKANNLIAEREISNGGIHIHININAPENRRDEYDDALSMLEYEVDDEVVLTQREFKAYVLNQWDWTNSFLMSNAAYVSASDVHAFSGQV